MSLARVMASLQLGLKIGILLAVTMQTNFNAKTQRCKDANAEMNFNIRKEAHLLVTSVGLGFWPQIPQEAQNLCVFCFFAPLR